MSWIEIYLTISATTLVVLLVVFLGDKNVRKYTIRNDFCFVMFLWFLACSIIWPIGIWTLVFDSRKIKKEMTELLEEAGEQ